MSYFVHFITREGEDRLIVLPGFGELLFWMIRRGRKCREIYIHV